MRKISTVILFLTAICALAWFLPFIYSVASPSPSSEPFLSFSPIADKWIITQKDSTDKVVYLDEEGNKYSQNQRDELLPQLYYRDLMARGVMPDTIQGIAVDVPALRHAEMMLNSNPRDINKVLPDIYLIMESMPERVDLEDPKEAFRADGKIEFLNLKDNSINNRRSRLFTETFAARGFEYPVKWANAQITARKNYDEGYLMIDNAGQLFHLKQQAGRPYLAKINTGDIKARYAFILENMNRTELGIVVSEDNDLYLLRNNGAYSLEHFPVGKVDPAKDRLMIWGNLFNRLVRVSSPEDGVRWYALDSRTNDLIGEKTYPAEKTLSARISEYIFPFALTFTSNSDSYGKPRIINVSYYSLGLNFLLACVLFVMFRKKNVRCAAGATFVTLFLGIYSFITFYLLKKS